MTDPATRLYFIVARKGPTAIVFRRGPTRQIELLTWNLETDELTAGQWLKGRIYERRCDLSPSGDLLIYFAAKYETPLRTWTAISKPPYLTALAFWPKGDAWGGGGLFDTEGRIRLNHRPAEQDLAEGFRLAPSMTVTPYGEHAGWGEDNPILHERLERDGWEWDKGESTTVEHGQKDRRWMTFTPAIRYTRPIGRTGSDLRLEQAVEGLKERGGSWYLINYRLVASTGEGIRDFGRADWADAAPNGDLLLAQDGRLYRLGLGSGADPTDDLQEVADLRHHRFENREAPESHRSW